MSKSTLSAIFAAAAVSTLAIGFASAEPVGGILSEIKGGVFVHDVGRDSINKTIESNTIDINAEILSVPLKFASSTTPALNSLYQPRVHLGLTANTAGWTNTAYTGLTWDWGLGAGFFLDFSFGFAAHDGQHRGKTDAKGNFLTGNGRPNLGSAILFREGLDLGYRFDGHNSISAFAGHISNAGWFAKQNDGMNWLGARYGYKFD